MGTAQAAANEMVRDLQQHPDLYYAGYTQDALKELTEAFLVLAFVSGESLPGPTEVGVVGATYLRGLAEAVTEMRRFILDLIRRGQVAEAEPFLTIMDDVYSFLIAIDFPDAITGGLRRHTDVVRGVLERTRGDLTVAVRQEQMRTTLLAFEEHLGMNHLGDILEPAYAPDGETGMTCEPGAADSRQ
ncbi:MAG: haloacid dehalogenase [Anaerolineae bacterium]|nr:MAG: haloacid dehalogenase [Anaerolineae bacterium]